MGYGNIKYSLHRNLPGGGLRHCIVQCSGKAFWIIDSNIANTYVGSMQKASLLGLALPLIIWVCICIGAIAVPPPPLCAKQCQQPYRPDHFFV